MDSPEVILRAPEPADCDVIFALEEDPRLWACGTTLAPTSRQMVKMYLEDYRADFTGDGELRLMVATPEGVPVGIVDLFDHDKLNHRAGIGIAILPHLQGTGLGRAALDALCTYAKLRCRLHTVWAHTAVDNVAAVALFERCGFRRVGLLKDWLFTPDGFKDVLFWQKLL